MSRLILAHELTVREAEELCGMAKSTFADAIKRTLQENENQSKKYRKQIDKQGKLRDQEKRTVKPPRSKLKKAAQKFLDGKELRRNFSLS